SYTTLFRSAVGHIAFAFDLLTYCRSLESVFPTHKMGSFIIAITGIYGNCIVNLPDMNLLVYLDALIKYGSATRAAEVLGVSQPGVSAALKRLRGLLDDPVMIRSGHRLLPTPKAFDIHQKMAG